MQSVPITTNVVRSNLACIGMISIGLEADYIMAISFIGGGDWST
jgi:hypothetical protein